MPPPLLGFLGGASDDGRDGGSPRGLLPSPLLGFPGGARDDGRDGRSLTALFPPPLCDLAGGDPDVDEHSGFPGTLPECRSDVGVALIRAARKKSLNERTSKGSDDKREAMRGMGAKQIDQIIIVSAILCEGSVED